MACHHIVYPNVYFMVIGMKCKVSAFSDVFSALLDDLCLGHDKISNVTHSYNFHSREQSYKLKKKKRRKKSLFSEGVAVFGLFDLWAQ